MKKKHNNIKILFIVGCIILVILLAYEIMHIYALFHSEVSGNLQFRNGKWNIIINGTEISKGIETSFVIDSIETENNEHVKENKLAPGLSGSFEISIVPQDTDVSIKYDVTLNQEQLGNNINIKSIQETDEGNTLVKTGENTYTGVIPLQKVKQGTTNNLKMEVEWQNIEEYDANDSTLGSQYNSKLQIPITVKVVQYLGEEIVPYVESGE